MAHLIANEFSSYEMTAQEALEGAILTVTQKQVIHNILSRLAYEKLNLEYDANNTVLFAQQEAYKKGQIEMLRELLDNSEEAHLVLYPTTSDHVIRK